MSYARRRVERELREYQDPPELRVQPFFRRATRAHDSRQYRSLVQVNFYPRPRADDRK